MDYAILEPLDRKLGRPVTIADWQALSEKHIATYTDDDLTIVRAFGGEGEFVKQRDARDRWHSPLPAPAPAPAAHSSLRPPEKAVAKPSARHPRTASTPKSLRDVTRKMWRLITDRRDPAFDRAKYQTHIQAKHHRTNVVTGAYDTVGFLVAEKQLEADPTNLTKWDLLQFEAVDPNLAERAQRAKEGRPLYDPDPGPLSDTPASVALVVAYGAYLTDQLSRTMATLVYRSRQAHQRIDDLERRAKSHDVVLKAGASDRAVFGTVMRYRGEFVIGDAYDPGDVVAHGGRVYVADATCLRADTPAKDPKYWIPLFTPGTTASVKAGVSGVASVDRLSALEQRMSSFADSLRALERRPTFEYKGVYVDGKTYERGDGVTWGGSMWHANESTTSKPGDGSKAWTLAVKKGRDGKDAGR